MFLIFLLDQLSIIRTLTLCTKKQNVRTKKIVIRELVRAIQVQQASYAGTAVLSTKHEAQEVASCLNPEKQVQPLARKFERTCLQCHIHDCAQNKIKTDFGVNFFLVSLFVKLFLFLRLTFFLQVKPICKTL